MNAGLLIQEARLRAGLSQAQLAERVGRDRAHIARWETSGVEPSFATLQEVLRACGYQLSTKLEHYEPVDDVRRRAIAEAPPSDRLRQMLDRRADQLRYGNGG